MRVCALCGMEFSETEAKRPCQGCPLGSSCNLICCPNCGYQTPEEPQWLTRLQRWWQNRKNPQKTCAVGAGTALTQTLAVFEVGQMGEIVEVCPPDDMTQRRLMALGLLPGVQLTLLRNFPCYLLQIGHAQIALDRKLAETITVRAVS